MQTREWSCPTEDETAVAGGRSPPSFLLTLPYI